MSHPLQSPFAFKQARRELGLSCEALARALHLGTERTLRRWEHGESSIPGPAAVAVGLMLREK